MPEQIKKSRQARANKESVADTVTESVTDTVTNKTSAPGAQSQDLVADLDSLLDEIDEVLEANAEEFVKSYVQKGGQ